MTINELITRLNEMGCTGDKEICVHAFGGMRSGKKDWIGRGGLSA